MASQEFRPTGFNVLPPVIKNLLIINGIFFIATLIAEQKFNYDLSDLLGLHYFFSDAFRPHQIITYMFMHAGFAHIFFNMFALWMFGNVLENFWGGKRFLIYYVVCGLGAALLHYTVHYFEIQPTLRALNDYMLNPSTDKLEGLFVAGYIKITSTDMAQHLQPILDEFRKNEMTGNAQAALQSSIDLVIEYKKEFLNEPVVVGASGSIFGLLLAFGMMFPNTMIYMYFLFPIKAKWFVIIYGAIELFGAVNPSQNDNIAHYAHLGGMLFGFIMIKLWQKKGGQPY